LIGQTAITGLLRVVSEIGKRRITLSDRRFCSSMIKQHAGSLLKIKFLASEKPVGF
jgi:hypothetical protein